MGNVCGLWPPALPRSMCTPTLINVLFFMHHQEEELLDPSEISTPEIGIQRPAEEIQGTKIS